ncbi:acyl carrier protein [Pigmentiphaga humi]|uniref:Acyl carrier protein n=1 Tax=Pigmentiphaga humi TaxID=2478468 RepID=A0A3P4B4Z8_9BURK|nr:phosphopantetheine-binding protein [Pigmentiphaga humi]VCU71367.1 acyl carrier protein [Pigmentiphaga humi]
MQALETELKNLIIESLGLEDVTPEDIDTHDALFGDGLGLDSVDALELGLSLQKKYGIAIDPDTKDLRQHFSSVAHLAAFVTSNRRN